MAWCALGGKARSGRREEGDKTILRVATARPIMGSTRPKGPLDKTLCRVINARARDKMDLSLQVHQQDRVVGLSVNVLTLPEFKTNCRVAPRNPQHPHISNLKHPLP